MDLATEVKNFLQSDAGQDAVAGSGQSAEVCLAVLLASSEMSAQEIKKSPRFNSPEGMWFLWTLICIVQKLLKEWKRWRMEQTQVPDKETIILEEEKEVYTAGKCESRF